MFFFQGVLPTPSSLQKQSHRDIFVLSKTNDTNTTTTILHNPAGHLDKRLPQSTSYVYHNEILSTLLKINQNYHRPLRFCIYSHVQAAELRINEEVKPSHMKISRRRKAFHLCIGERTLIKLHQLLET